MTSVRPRVLLVMEATIGGTKRHLLELAGGLRGAGWDVEVASPRVRGAAFGDVSFWDDLLAAGIPVHEVPMVRHPFSGANVRATRELARLLRRGRYDVVHAHSSIAGAVVRPAALLARAGGVRPRVVYTPHGFAFLAPGGRLRRWAFLAVERALGRVTDRLIAVSPTEAEAANAYGVVPAARVVTIPNGVAFADLPTPDRRQEVRRREGWGDDLVVGTVARMTPQKDPTTWLETASRLAASCPTPRFVWVWGGELESDIRSRLHHLGLSERLVFTGYRPDARELIGAFDVFLLTSRFEGLPYTVIEALASRTPVVATDVIGTRDVIRHGVTGLLAPAGDVTSLAGHVLRLLEDPALGRRLAQAGREDVVSRFSVANMVTRTAAVYSSMIADP
ncbi:MAG: glycosyltransferase family 4 protein [Chloroflexota bacterium]|nr:glycosyltransferase family 4 protein [Chloroflexota bacterium]